MRSPDSVLKDASSLRWDSTTGARIKAGDLGQSWRPEQQGTCVTIRSRARHLHGMVTIHHHSDHIFFNEYQTDSKQHQLPLSIFQLLFVAAPNQLSTAPPPRLHVPRDTAPSRGGFKREHRRGNSEAEASDVARCRVEGGESNRDDGGRFTCRGPEDFQKLQKNLLSVDFRTCESSRRGFWREREGSFHAWLPIVHAQTLLLEFKRPSLRGGIMLHVQFCWTGFPFHPL